MAGKSFLVPIFCCLLLLSGCEKNETKYIADNQTNGLAVFSNTGNNIMTCFINGSPWRTDNRIVGGWGPGSTDLSIFKQYDSSFHYSLVFAWPGNLVNDSADIYLIELHLFVPANFSQTSFDSLQGKRITIDSTTGFFSIANYSLTGNGTIYFNRASYDSAASKSGNAGEFSGLFEANIPGYTITQARFDNDLPKGSIQF